MVTYNVLADAYIRPAYFPRTPAEILAPDRRLGALMARLGALSPDVLCLQELEADRFEAVRAALTGYRAEYARKGERKPDGCGTFSRAPVVRSERFEYGDGTGHIALLVELERDGRRLGVANTHLRFDSHDGRPGLGAAQLARLLDRVEESSCHGWVVCGDFNARPDSFMLRQALERGWLDGGARAPTCNSNARAKRIDFLLHSASLQAEPHPHPALRDDTPMPSESEPSDHLAVGATFAWREFTSG